MVYPRIEIIKHKGKMRLNPETGNRFRQRDVRKKDNWVFDHYNMGVILNNGFVGEQWRSLKKFNKTYDVLFEEQKTLLKNIKKKKL